MSTLKYKVAPLATLLLSLNTYATQVIDDTPWPLAPSPKNSSNLSVEKRPIFILAFVHDDVPESTIASIFPGHLVPFIKELRETTGRRVSVELVRNAPPYTNYAYKGTSQDSYDGWRQLGTDYRDKNNLPVNRTTKFILLTKDYMNAEVLGVAVSGQQFGIASLVHKQIVGHELGHLLDAQHELSEERFNGWICETFMVPKVDPLKGNCYVFTDPNRSRINAYLADVP
ncbi:MAG: hypothetical protein JWP42_1994 [Pseudomonas sp.]|nr:hypothetical protein [Pseudomonas sp.]